MLRSKGMKAGLAALALAGCGAAAYPIVSGRTEPLRYAMDSARKAVEKARSERADVWAPREMMQAEAALRQALAEHRRQEVRFVLLRDFRVAKAALTLAETKGKTAELAAETARDEARTAADEAIAAAESELGVSEDVADALHLRPAERRSLQRSRISLQEARLRHRDGDYRGSLASAQESQRRAKDLTAKAVVMASRFSDPGLVRHWRNLVNETIAESRRTGGTAIVVVKDTHRLTVYRAGRPVKTFRAEFGYNLVNDKQVAGDGATPEGRYRVTEKKNRSTYYRALLLNYPNDEDRASFARMRRNGQIHRRAGIGGLIEIHGEGGRGKDWTKGCVALRNSEMDTLFSLVGTGTPVTIVGSEGRGQGLLDGLLAQQRANGSPANGNGHAGNGKTVRR